MVGPFGKYSRGPITLPDFAGPMGIDLGNIRSCAVAYYVGTFARIGVFRAADELVSRFLDGFDVGTGDLAAKLCGYVEKEPTRLAEDDRDVAITRLFEDSTLETLLERLSDATIAWDLSRSAGTFAIKAPLKWLPESTARLAVHAAIEDLQLFLDDRGGAGVALAAHMAGEQLVDIIDILNDPALALHLSGESGIFGAIAELLTDDPDRPTELEAQQLARMASSGRKAILEAAAIVDGGTLPNATEADLDRLGAAVYEWRAAHGTLDVDVLFRDASDDVSELSDDDGLDAIRLRRR